jgi:hypothetical protein
MPLSLRFPVLPPVAALLFALAVAAPAQEPARASTDTLPRQPHGRPLRPPAASGRRIEEVRRFPAPEAHQGVAVDARYFYAVDNARIAKYERASGRRVAEWTGTADGPIIHLNSCIVAAAELVCAHSNYPGVPMLSSLESWSTAELKHTASRSLGVYEGSLTWAVRRGTDWWLCFANYGNASGTPGRGPEWTTLVQFDERWNRKAAYAFPVRLMERLAPNSSSGGSWGADGLLYVSGHDEAELYVLRLPEMGSVLEWVDTIPAPIEGQAWVFDPADPNVIWGIRRSTSEVVVGASRK